MNRKYTLRKEERIRKGKEFRGVFKSGRCFREGSLRIYVLRGKGLSRKAGFVVADRANPAVKRNRTKRLLREVYRKNKNELPQGISLVFVTRASSLTLQELERIVLRLFEKVL